MFKKDKAMKDAFKAIEEEINPVEIKALKIVEGGIITVKTRDSSARKALNELNNEAMNLTYNEGDQFVATDVTFDQWTFRPLQGKNRNEVGLPAQFLTTEFFSYTSPQESGNE